VPDWSLLTGNGNFDDWEALSIFLSHDE
jgi:hypothetical protein